MASKHGLIVLVLVNLIAPPTTARAGQRMVVASQATVVASGLVVTQFAVPVAVPQYVVPVAPQSYVQYGMGASGYSTTSQESLEDRIAAKVIRGLQASGGLKALAEPPTLVSRNCTSCHSGAAPKGNLDLTDLARLSAERRLKCIGRVLADDEAVRMPPKASGATLNPDELGKLLQELSQTPQEKSR